MSSMRDKLINFVLSRRIHKLAERLGHSIVGEGGVHAAGIRAHDWATARAAAATQSTAPFDKPLPPDNFVHAREGRMVVGATQGR